MSETIERRLKDINGLHVYKVIDNKGLKTEKVTYLLNTEDEDNINCFSSLKELKEYANNYW